MSPASDKQIKSTKREHISSEISLINQVDAIQKHTGRMNFGCDRIESKALTIQLENNNTIILQCHARGQLLQTIRNEGQGLLNAII
jgi:hypothetical protein